MTMEIYWGGGSPYAWRILLALQVKQVPHEAHLLEFSRGDTRTAEFLALNPRGKVPVLKDGDFVLTESLAILAYLERKYPGRPLLGPAAEETGRIWKAISEQTHYLLPAIDSLVRRVFFGPRDGTEDQLRDAANALHAELQLMNKALAGQEWLAGPDLTAADICAYPFVEILLRAADKEAAKPLDLGLLPITGTYPALAAWRDRIRALPGYDKTYPPHWREADRAAAIAAAS